MQDRGSTVCRQWVSMSVSSSTVITDKDVTIGFLAGLAARALRFSPWPCELFSYRRALILKSSLPKVLKTIIFLPQPPDSRTRGKRQVWASLMSPRSSICSSLAKALAVHETQLEVARLPVEIPVLSYRG
jgi:hypothetical protein